MRVLLAMAILATTLIVPPAVMASAPMWGQIGTGVALLSERPKTVEELIPGDPTCQAALNDTLAVLPFDYGTDWRWGKMYNAGQYFLNRNTIALDDDIDCKWIPIVAVHEWVHQLQDITGMFNWERVNGVHRLELVAECTARVLAAPYGWEHYESYPEQTGVSCDAFAEDVQALLSLI